jgi:hypothetical protein
MRARRCLIGPGRASTDRPNLASEALQRALTQGASIASRGRIGSPRSPPPAACPRSNKHGLRQRVRQGRPADIARGPQCDRRGQDDARHSTECGDVQRLDQRIIHPALAVAEVGRPPPNLPACRCSATSATPSGLLPEMRVSSAALAMERSTWLSAARTGKRQGGGAVWRARREGGTGPDAVVGRRGRTWRAWGAAPGRQAPRHR